MKGRKPEPAKLKLIKGTDRVDRINPDAPEQCAEALAIPATLPAEAIPHFEKLRAHLKALKLDSSTYAEVVAIAAQQMAVIEYCNAKLQQHGEHSYETETIQGGRMVRAYPEVAMRSEAMRHLHSLLSELGLTPAAIGKVSASLPEKPKSKWGKFGG